MKKFIHKFRLMFWILGLIAVIFYLFSPRPEKPAKSVVQESSQKPAFSVKLPNFNMQQYAGQKKFEDNCMQCHGKHAIGTGNGPPLIHNYYKPKHHSDYAFYRAAQQGVRAHHWKFGNMPPILAVKKEDITQIISYVRAIQRENGIQ